MELGGVGMNRRFGATTAVLVTAVVALAACSSGEGRTVTLGSPSSTSDSGTGSVTQWIAIFRTAVDPGALADDTSKVKAVVDGSIVVSPAACFDGLPSSIRPDAYVLGVVAPSEHEVDALVAEVDRPVSFEGQVRTMCLD